ncbi:MAG: protease complex subunit PrcB family protein [Gemmatimonadetes bacterium]|nr:protease complex subunit PrcB family protein [Gemmatimonadota bacterium]
MRSTRLMMLVLAALAAGCTELPSIDPGFDEGDLGGEPVPVTRVHEAFPAGYSGLAEQAQLVVESRAEWEEVWRRMWQYTDPAPAAPAIDFSRHTVVVAAMGSRPTGGAGVRVEKAASHADHVVVQVVETSAGDGCGTTQAVSAPVDVVAIPRTPQPIRFRIAQTVRECS